MFLTRFTLNAARRGAKRLMTSPQAMHAAVLAGFAEPPPPGPDGRILWRVDDTGPGRLHLFIVSPGEPDLTHLVEQAGWPTTHTWQTRPYGGFLAALRDGQRWAFRLTANPVHSARPPKHPNADTKRFGHVTVAQQEKWLHDRTARSGFQIVIGQTGQHELVTHSRTFHDFKRQGDRVTLRVATFDGHLEVTDADALRRTLATGLGPAKAYGCGLLTLAPA